MPPEFESHLSEIDTKTTSEQIAFVREHFGKAGKEQIDSMPLGSIERTPRIPEQLYHISQSAEKIIESASRITIEECLSLYELHRQEARYAAAFFETKDNIGKKKEFITSQYESIKKSKLTMKEKAHQTLALTCFAMTQAYGNEITPFSARYEQRLALLRSVEMLIEDPNSKLVLDMQTSEGKSSVIIEGLLPALFLLKEKVDITTRRRVTRDSVSDRAFTLCNLFNIPSHTYRPDGIAVLPGGLLIKSRKDDENEVLSKGVTFLLEADLGHFLMRSIRGESPFKVNPSSRLLITDEVEEGLLEGTNMIISGDDETACTLIAEEWNPSTDPKEAPHLKKRLSMIFSSMPEHISAAEKLFEKHVGKNKETAIKAVALLRYIFEQLPDMREYQFSSWRGEFFSSDGSLTQNGWKDIKRRLWTQARQNSYGPNKEVPEDWMDILSMVFSSKIENTVNSFLVNIQSGSSYYFQDPTKMVLASKTGDPLFSREYDILTTTCIWAFESLKRPDLQFPLTLHATIDELSPMELRSLAYSSEIGLSGTATHNSVAQELYGLWGFAIQRIPPHKESTLEFQHPYIPVSSEEEKFSKMVETIISQIQDRELPSLLIDVPTIPIAKRLELFLKTDLTGIAKNMLDRQRIDVDTYESIVRCSQSLTIQISSPENDYITEELHNKAGNMNTITISKGKARREVDIKNLSVVIGWEPADTQWSTRQLAGRAGRQGGKGRYLCLVAQTDELFKHLPRHRKDKLNRYLKANDVSKIESLITEAQERYQETIREKNISRFLQTKPLATIRKHLHAIESYEARGKMLHIWPALLHVVKIRFNEFMTGQIPDSSNLMETRWVQYQSYIYKMYLQLYDKARTSISNEDISSWFMNNYYNVDLLFTS